MLHQLPDAGTHSEALSSRCAETCWVSGHADGRVALWSFDPANVTGTATRDSTLPSMEIDADGPGPENRPIGRPARSPLQPRRQHPRTAEGRPQRLANLHGTGRFGTRRDHRWRPSLRHHPNR